MCGYWFTVYRSRVEGSELGVQGLVENRVYHDIEVRGCNGFRLKLIRLELRGLGSMVQGSEFRVWNLGFVV
jgi:hypothetical protein